MKHLCALAAFFLLASASLLAASNPVPLLYQVSPASIRPGHTAFAMQVRGTGFVSGATVLWNGQALPTTFVNATLLKAAVPASDVSARGTASLTVANQGSIASNVIYFTVRVASPTVALAAAPTGIEPGIVTVADFNNDSVPDVGVYGVSSTSFFYLDTFLGNGKGNFSRVLGPRSVAFLAWACGPNLAADFNNDGKIDMSLCNAGNSGDGLGLYLGDGTAHFTPDPNSGPMFGTGVAADMNGDGNLDFVSVFSDGMAQVAVALGDGHGTFTLILATIVNNYRAAYTPLVGDFNGDGKLDIAVPSPHTVAVFLGNGDGTLQPEVDYAITADSTNSGTSAIVADVNGDGNLDIVTNGVGVLLGAGDGTFTNAFSIPLSTDTPLGELRVGDINGDGKLDLATIAFDQSSGHNFLNVLLGKGDGTFQPPIAYDLNPHLDLGYSTMGMADFDNNGRLDFVIGGSPTTLFMVQK